LPNKVAYVAKSHPKDEVEIWSEDEHRLGLQPILRAVWIEKGSKNVLVPVKPGYEWFYLYAFIHPRTGRNYWWILPNFNNEMFELALTDFAKEFGAGKGKQIILVVDQAACHMSAKVKIPKGIHIQPLPPKSPELQPAERLWELSDETVANKAWTDIEKMKDELFKRCQQLRNDTKTLLTRTLFHWWPEEITNNV
jgi:transposase